MINLSPDTCVLLCLLGVGPDIDHGEFDELCYWIENGHIKLIVAENVVREWDRLKSKKVKELVDAEEKQHLNLSKAYLQTELTKTTSFNKDSARDFFTKRVERVDLILNTLAEKANETQEIYDEARKRCLFAVAPNHLKDSFGDTVSILSLIDYLKTKGYAQCYFATSDSDFCNPGKNHDLHDQLAPLFRAVSLEYAYVENKPYGVNFFAKIRSTHRSDLPDFREYLNARKETERLKEMEERASPEVTVIENPDKDFIKNTRYIDSILSNPSPTDFEKEMLATLIKRHPSYEQHFLRKVGNDGLV